MTVPDMQNWVGGVATANAAQQIHKGRKSIPSIGKTGLRPYPNCPSAGM